jgi:predicted transcriptional regulator
MMADETLFLVVDELHSNLGVGVSEIAVDLGLSKSAVHKHLRLSRNTSSSTTRTASTDSA